MASRPSVFEGSPSQTLYSFSCPFLSASNTRCFWRLACCLRRFLAGPVGVIGFDECHQALEVDADHVPNGNVLILFLAKYAKPVPIDRPDLFRTLAFLLSLDWSRSIVEKRRSCGRSVAQFDSAKTIHSHGLEQQGAPVKILDTNILNRFEIQNLLFGFAIK